MELAKWITPKYLSEQWIENASAEMTDASPFPHMQLSNFLLKEQFTRLEEQLSEQEFTYKENDLFSLSQTPALTQVTEGPIKEFADMLNSDEFRTWMSKVSHVRTTPGKLDLFGAVYQDSDYLLPHDDQLEDRKIAFILYVTTLAKDEGGALSLYTDKDGHPDEVVKRLPVHANALSFFVVSPQSWHEVEEVTADAYRVSIGGWLHG